MYTNITIVILHMHVCLRPKMYASKIHCFRPANAQPVIVPIKPFEMPKKQSEIVEFKVRSMKAPRQLWQPVRDGSNDGNCPLLSYKSWFNLSTCIIYNINVNSMVFGKSKKYEVSFAWPDYYCCLNVLFSMESKISREQVDRCDCTPGLLGWVTALWFCHRTMLHYAHQLHIYTI